MKSPDDLKALLPPVPAWHDLPRRGGHKADLLALIAASPRRTLGARAAPGQLRPNRGPRRWLVATASAVAVVTIGLVAVLVPRPAASPRLESRGGGNLRTTRHWIVPATGLSSLTVVTTSGNIAVTGDGSAVASVTAVPRYQDNIPTLTSRIADGTLTIRAGCRGSGPCEVSVTIHVPARLLVTAHADQGDLQLSGMSRGVVASTGQGTIDLSDVAGPVTASTSQGDIRCTGLATPSAKLTSDQGDVHVLFRTPPALVTATTQEGSVDIQLPSTAAYDIIARAEIGTTTITAPRSANSSRVITATSQVGSVQVTG